MNRTAASSLSFAVLGLALGWSHLQDEAFDNGHEAQRRQLVELIDQSLSQEIESLRATGGRSGVPIGSVVAWPSDRPLPSENWRVCDGGSVPITGTDDPLYRVLGGTYGVRTSAVVLPDFRGCFLRGFGDFDSDRTSAGWGIAQRDAIQEHTHRDRGHRHSREMASGDEDGHGAASDGTSGRHSGDPTGLAFAQLGGAVAKAGDPDVRVARETRPVNYAVRWIIRVK